MPKESNIGKGISYLFGIMVFMIGLANLVLVHPVPGIVFLLLSLLYLPLTNVILKQSLGFAIPPVVKILLAIFIIWFTLGVSDGRYDRLSRA